MDRSISPILIGKRGEDRGDGNKVIQAFDGRDKEREIDDGKGGPFGKMQVSLFKDNTKFGKGFQIVTNSSKRKRQRDDNDENNNQQQKLLNLSKISNSIYQLEADNTNLKFFNKTSTSYGKFYKNNTKFTYKEFL